jgi:hypothetical protein
MVTSEVDTPSGSTGPAPVIELVEIEALPAINTTDPPVTLPGLTIESCLDSAFVELRVQLDLPLVSDDEQLP